MWNAHVTILKLNSSVLWQAWTKTRKILENYRTAKGAGKKYGAKTGEAP